MAIEHPGGVPNPVTGHSLLAHLETEELAKLSRFARTEHYPKGAVIFRKGEPGTSMMTVAEGRIKISASSRDGKEAVLAVLAKGDVLGEMAILDGGPRSADATALEPTELVVIDQRDFIPFLERNPKIAVRLLRLLSERLRRTSEQVEDRSFLSLSARLAKTLLDLADEDGLPVPEGIKVPFRMSQRIDR